MEFVTDDLPMQREGGRRELRNRRLLGLNLEEMEIEDSVIVVEGPTGCHEEGYDWQH